jgi:Family of unknown function (DUF6356)
MIHRLFIAHPQSVGEGYFEHMQVAGRFGLTMIAGGIKALIHAVFPTLCETSGSETVRVLHNSIVEKRGAKRDATMEMHSVEWMI